MPDEKGAIFKDKCPQRGLCFPSLRYLQGQAAAIATKRQPWQSSAESSTPFRSVLKKTNQKAHPEKPPNPSTRGQGQPYLDPKIILCFVSHFALVVGDVAAADDAVDSPLVGVCVVPQGPPVVQA